MLVASWRATQRRWKGRVLEEEFVIVCCCHPQVREWVAANIERWKREKPTWFNVELIPDEFLPAEVLAAEGGAMRRRSSVSIREVVGLDGNGRRNSISHRVHPEDADE